MLRALPANWFSWDFNVFDGDKHLALIDQACLREAGELLLEGTRYKASRESWLGGAFLLETEGRVVARAIKPSAWRRAFEVQHDNKTYTLKARSSWGRTFELLDGEIVIGSMRPAHSFTRKAEVEFPDSIPLPVRVFMVWLTIILWKRDQDAAASGAASG
jgi:hypothetical protein